MWSEVKVEKLNPLIEKADPTIDITDFSELMSQAYVSPIPKLSEVSNLNRANSIQAQNAMRHVNLVKLGNAKYYDEQELPLKSFNFRAYVSIDTYNKVSMCINKSNKIYVDLSSGREFFFHEGSFVYGKQVEVNLRYNVFATREDVDKFFKDAKYTIYPADKSYSFETRLSGVSCGIYTCHGLDNIGVIPYGETKPLIVYYNRHTYALIFEDDLADYVKYKILESELKYIKSSVIIFSTNKTRNSRYVNGKNFVEEYFGKYLLVDFETRNANSKNDINTWIVDLNKYQVDKGFKKESK